MKKSKKGVTLVELIICCFIIVMLGGACTALLISGEHVYSTSAEAAGAQLDSDVVQTYMMKLLPPSETMSQLSLAEAKLTTSGNCLYFDDENDGEFTIRIDGDNTTIESVTGFKYAVVRAGDADSASARAQFVYKVTMSDNSEFIGGFIMSNMKYSDSWIDSTQVDEDGYADLLALPFYFSPTLSAE